MKRHLMKVKYLNKFLVKILEIRGKKSFIYEILLLFHKKVVLDIIEIK